MPGVLSPNLPSALYAECFAKVPTESDKGRLEVRILLADQSFRIGRFMGSVISRSIEIGMAASEASFPQSARTTASP